MARVPRYLGRLGFPWGGTEAVAQRPEWLANHWPQLPRWTERQAPNVNIGASIGEQSCLGALNFTTCHFFSILWDLNCSTESLLSPSISLGSLLQLPVCGCKSTRLS